MPTSKSFMTQLGPVDPAMMDSLPETLDVEVISPCTGDQSLVRQSDELYAGSSGDFTYVTLYSISVSGNPSWEMKVWDYRHGSGCYGTSYYRRNPADGNPVGNYCLYDGSMKCNDGSATVST